MTTTPLLTSTAVADLTDRISQLASEILAHADLGLEAHGAEVLETPFKVYQNGVELTLAPLTLRMKVDYNGNAILVDVPVVP